MISLQWRSVKTHTHSQKQSVIRSGKDPALPQTKWHFIYFSH